MGETRSAAKVAAGHGMPYDEPLRIWRVGENPEELDAINVQCCKIPLDKKSPLTKLLANIFSEEIVHRAYGIYGVTTHIRYMDKGGELFMSLPPWVVTVYKEYLQSYPADFDEKTVRDLTSDKALKKYFKTARAKQQCLIQV